MPFIHRQDTPDEYPASRTGIAQKFEYGGVSTGDKAVALNPVALVCHDWTRTTLDASKPYHLCRNADPLRLSYSLAGCHFVSTSCTVETYARGYARCGCIGIGFKPSADTTANPAGARNCLGIKACLAYNGGAGYTCERVKECTGTDWGGGTCSKAGTLPAKNPACSDNEARTQTLADGGHACTCTDQHYTLELPTGSTWATKTEGLARDATCYTDQDATHCQNKVCTLHGDCVGSV